MNKSWRRRSSARDAKGKEGRAAAAVAAGQSHLSSVRRPHTALADSNATLVEARLNAAWPARIEAVIDARKQKEGSQHV
jgi:hypothetical protein